MEFFRIDSRIESLDASQPGESDLGLRLRAALFKHAARAWGGRWRGPFEEDEDGEGAERGSPRFYDRIAQGPDSDPVTVLSATRNDGAAQGLRAALYRAADPAAPFPPVCLTPNSEIVRSGALHAGLQRLSDRSVPVHAVDLLGVDGSAMPEALRVLTAAIARDRNSEHPGRWIVILDPLYERRIGPWSDDDFYGQIQIERSQPIDRVSLEIEIEPGSSELSASVQGSLAALYLGIATRGSTRSGVDQLADDVATLHNVVERALESVGEKRPIETRRSLSLNPFVEDLSRLANDYERHLIDKDEFVDTSLDILAELRRDEPEESIPVAEFIAAWADTHPFEPVPLPDDANFVETIGRPPAVQRIVGGPRPGPRSVP